MATKALFISIVLLLMGGCTAQAQLSTNDVVDALGTARQLLQVTKPNKAKDPKAASGVDHFFKRLEKFAFASSKPKRMLLLTDDTAVDGQRQLLQVTKPNKAKDPKAASGVDHFFKRLEKFAFASSKPKL